MQISDDDSNKSVSSLAKSVENGEISSSSSEWKIDSDELFITYLNRKEIRKLIKNYFHLFINASLNHISIRSRLVSQPNKKLNSNSEQLFNATHISPILKLRGKISTHY